MPDDRLYHLALTADWAEATAPGGEYRMSTLGVTLAEQGFVHLAFADQVPTVADRFYRGRTDVLLLTVDPALLTAPLRLEDVGGQTYPHLHGPLDPAAVVEARPLTTGPAAQAQSRP